MGVEVGEVGCTCRLPLPLLSSGPRKQAANPAEQILILTPQALRNLACSNVVEYKLGTSPFQQFNTSAIIIGVLVLIRLVFSGENISYGGYVEPIRSSKSWHVSSDWTIFIRLGYPSVSLRSRRGISQKHQVQILGQPQR
jgi:hypothetical protein